MGEPCRQEKAIGGLEATVQAIKETLEHINEAQIRFINVLEKISEQSTEIANIKKSHSELFRRIRDIEIKQEGERVKIAGIVAGVSVFVSALGAWISKHL